jgi:hypothetical protein
MKKNLRCHIGGFWTGMEEIPLISMARTSEHVSDKELPR